MDRSKVTPVQIDIHSLHADILTVSKQELCAKYLGLSYIEEQIPQNQIFVLAYNDKTPIGYVMASYLPKGGVYLDVICALERKGPALLSLFLQVCQEQIGASYIQLSSLMHVLTFYPKYGFSHRRSCDEPPNIAMSPELSAYILDKMRAGVLTSDEAFFDDPKIARFLQELHRLGYTKKPHILPRRSLKCRSPKTTPLFQRWIYNDQMSGRIYSTSFHTYCSF